MTELEHHDLKAARLWAESVYCWVLWLFDFQTQIGTTSMVLLGLPLADSTCGSWVLSASTLARANSLQPISFYTQKPPSAKRRSSLDPWVGKIPWRRKWQPTPVGSWEIPWTEEPGGLQSMGFQRFVHN